MRFKGYIFDLDGTIYSGSRLIPGTDGVVATLRNAGKRVVFVSNKTLSTPAEYATKLTLLGVPSAPSDVVNAGCLTIDCLLKDHAGARIFLIGEEVLAGQLTSAGFSFAESPEETDVVLISLDRGLSYEKIHFAYRAARSGAVVWATNPDLICPDGGNEIVDAGATIAAIEALTHRPVDRIIGKPSETMSRLVAEMMDLPPADCVVVGDRIETDVALGKQAGMGTALVLTGVTDRARLAASDLKPDYVLETLEDLLDV